MKVLFDTSALVTAVVDQLENHSAALASYRRFAQPRRGRSQAVCSTHVVAECYATLTALPLARRIQPAEATRLIEDNFLNDLEVVPLSAADYKSALARVAEAGGTVISPAIEIPAGRFFYATDPDGNSIGLFEAA